MKARKPKVLEVGKAYRLWLPFCAGPSDDVVLVTGIGERVGRSWHRSIELEFVSTDRLDARWRFYSYAELYRRVHSAAPTAIN